MGLNMKSPIHLNPILILDLCQFAKKCSRFWISQQIWIFGQDWTTGTHWTIGTHWTTGTQINGKINSSENVQVHEMPNITLHPLSVIRQSQLVIGSAHETSFTKQTSCLVEHSFINILFRTNFSNTFNHYSLYIVPEHISLVEKMTASFGNW